MTAPTSPSDRHPSSAVEFIGGIVDDARRLFDDCLDRAQVLKQDARRAIGDGMRSLDHQAREAAEAELNRLQERLAHLQSQLAQLSDTLASQDRDRDRDQNQHQDDGGGHAG
ncbi:MULTISPECIES: hypothetical protein [Streptomycetaceae]|uniref:Uncharacterized protein n=1 Tax=Streptantibioticus cattleyicolor (strain ATCC 35852 / DSM 46488 / JCM 4925 / NBRC 14057 / NRRL 8057) TaxID=1003195 RepID=F8JRM5_STREN|nr:MULTISPECIES: hypothetical protein [Streptomycetaceae]AEW97909.1 hypothetical protein SCATT_55380 [Streptantibioticus cattleyicolor NRRL 8057 = DSM 46488]MYS62316.1 hypothetical protein [Streptomyces sp. SID5468]CCB78226.1 protein of unknown function [Streptantibioticus cattleyicolor NRRL 8057 = DSM 46488]